MKRTILHQAVKSPKQSSNPKDTAHKALDTIPETTKTKQEIEDRLISARISMLLNCPFYGNLACRLEMKDATDWCPTAATDGKYFYYNRHFVDALKQGELISVSYTHLTLPTNREV